MASSILHSIARSVAAAAGVAVAVTMACPALGATAKPPAIVTDKVTDKPAATLAQSQLPISIDASSSEFDYGKNRLVFHKVTITQGRLRVAAGEATGTDLNFDNSKWQFVGDVHITMEHGSLDSDRADVTFASHSIARAVINGTPATFEQALEKPPQIARGHANVIEYDVANGTVRLADNAWLSDGQNELSGAVLVYDIRAERVVANAPAAGEGRVRIIINPQKRKPAVPAADPSK